MIHPREELLKTKGYCDASDAELAEMVRLASELSSNHDVVRYLEIGVLGGYTIWFLKNRIRNLEVTGVDMFEDFKNIAHYGNTHDGPTYAMADVQEMLGSDVRLVKGNSALVVPKLSDRFHLAFVDGNHTYLACKTDVENCTVLLERGGYVALHNASNYIFPDNRYAATDGGPWKVAQEMKFDRRFRHVSDIERLSVFKKL